MVSMAEKELRALGMGSSSPEVVRAEVLRKDAETFAGVGLGYAVNKYGIVFGLDYGFKALGEATKVPAVKDYSTVIARGVSAGGSLIALLLLKGKWSRKFAFGVLFEDAMAFLDMGAEVVKKAVAGASEKK